MRTFWLVGVLGQPTIVGFLEQNMRFGEYVAVHRLHLITWKEA
jgi:hypothetical protein